VAAASSREYFAETGSDPDPKVALHLTLHRHIHSRSIDNTLAHLCVVVVLVDEGITKFREILLPSFVHAEGTFVEPRANTKG